MQTENQKKYDKYMEEVRKAVEEKTGCSVTIHKVNKINDLQLDGLMIMQEGINISPTIYLNPYYEDYIENGLSAVVEKIVAIYETNKQEKFIDVSFFTEIEKVRPIIKMKLINYEKNQALLKQVPYIRFLDLAIVFLVVLEESGGNGFASILVYHHHLDYWNIEAEELYKIAMENTENDFSITSMIDIFNEFTGNEYEIEENIECRMSVLTNRYKLRGA